MVVRRAYVARTAAGLVSHAVDGSGLDVSQPEAINAQLAVIDCALEAEDELGFRDEAVQKAEAIGDVLGEQRLGIRERSFRIDGRPTDL